MAAVLPIFLAVVLGIMDLGRAAYTYNGLSNLAREASHYAMLEYSSDDSSPCFWSNFDSASCLAQVKSYALGLNMVPNLYSVNVAVDLVACQGACTSSGYPITVSMATHFQPISTQMLGIGPFDITASSTSQFVQPPASTATPSPTPTTTGSEVAPSGVTVTPAEHCDSNCQEFTVTWTPPSNIDAIGHYEIAYGTSGSYIYSGPEPARVNGVAVYTTTVDLPSEMHSECIQVTAFYQDSTAASAAGGWHDSSASAPSC
jgi:Flp pilus assembly protein TadG